jgi:hypothetical protein
MVTFAFTTSGAIRNHWERKRATILPHRFPRLPLGDESHRAQSIISARDALLQHQTRQSSGRGLPQTPAGYQNREGMAEFGPSQDKRCWMQGIPVCIFSYPYQILEIGLLVHPVGMHGVQNLAGSLKLLQKSWFRPSAPPLRQDWPGVGCRAEWPAAPPSSGAKSAGEAEWSNP